MPLLGVWSLRRVLLAGLSGDMLCAMESQLRLTGARPLHTAVPLCEESLSRILQQRCACIIVPDMFHLCSGGADARLASLNMLLFEAREAGVPLVMLLCRTSAAHDEEAAALFSHALGFARGASGDPVNIQCIRHHHTDSQRACRDALMLGARFLSGRRACTGFFSL